MNDLLSALHIKSFDRVLSAYASAEIELHDAIDGGAGWGQTAAEILPFLRSSALVHAFEPFPGNHRFFEGRDPRIRLIPKALAETAKQMSFSVASTVSQDSDWGRRGLVGYSSTGRLVAEAPASGTTMTVDCVRADAEVQEPREVSFVKLDLQGGELDALRGCTQWLDKVRLMWIEYSAQPGLLDFLQDAGFMLFDTEFLFWGVPGEQARKSFDIARQGKVSTSAQAWYGFRRKPWKDFEAEMLKLKRSIRLVQTDLLCINRRDLPAFMAAAPYLAAAKAQG